jgi:DNA polymerase-3 subunit alpha
VEAYLTPGTSRFDRSRVSWGDGGQDDVSGAGAYTHLTMLAADTGGMHNLFRLASLASLEGHFYKPRMDRELLNRYARGLIATTGCPSGEVQVRLRLGQYDAAREAAAEFRDIFGAENFFCELMDHGLPIERRVQQDLLRLARDLGLPLLATNDLHYTRAEDAQAHAVLLCVQSGSTLADPKRFKFDAGDFTSSPPSRARALAGAARGLRQHAAGRRGARGASPRELMPRFTSPPGRTRSPGSSGGRARAAPPLPGGIPDEVRKGAD